MDKTHKHLFRRGIGRSLWLAALMLLAVQGCVTIDDNTDDCISSAASLRFEYTYNLSGEDLFRDQVESIDLYVYGKSTGSLVAIRHFTQANLISWDYRVSLQWLPPGDYNIVAFGNINEVYYRCSGYETISSLRLRMICGDGLGSVTTNPGTFFYGVTEIEREDSGEKLVSMIKNTNDINITIKNKVTRAGETGLPDLTISVTLRNGTLRHDNSIADDDRRLMTHISDNRFDEHATELKTTLTVGRLFSTDGSVITIKEKESGRELSSENLTEKIVHLLAEDTDYNNMDPDEYLDRQDSYNLVYQLEMKYGVLVTTLITIGDWNVIENPIGGV